MREIIIGTNDAGRRLDRFLRKYLREASLGEIYKLIRKDIKVDGKRRDQSYMLSEGEVINLYISDEVLGRMTGEADTGSGIGPGGRRHISKSKAKRQFAIIYEDDQILIADKPFGLLTHGDSHEKKDHLANQVKDYLIERGDYDPGSERVFSPAPANRIDRNTTGLVLFGKTATALKDLNTMIREDMIDKYYLTIVSGIIDKEMTLTGSLIKDERSNKVKVSHVTREFTDVDRLSAMHGRSSANMKGFSAKCAGISYAGRSSDPDSGREIITVVKPLEHFSVRDTSPGKSGARPITATLAEIHLVTGRPHQIRAHLASIGHPVIGDAKYADRHASRLNDYAKKHFGLTTQLLHARRIEFRETTEKLAYLRGRSFEASLPARFEKILANIRG